jgi:hypothetical protein
MWWVILAQFLPSILAMFLATLHNDLKSPAITTGLDATIPIQDYWFNAFVALGTPA